MEPDSIDRLVGQWQEVRPDLDAQVMAEVARLLRVAQLIDARLEATAADHGVSRGEGDVLFTLRRSGPPYRLPPTRLAASMLVTSGTMTNRLDRLERRGYIRRIPSTTDRRSLEVELTDEARRLVDEAVVEHVRREEEILAALTGREREQLQRLLRKLMARLSAES